MVKQTRKTAKSAAVLIKKAVVAVTKAVAKMLGSLVGMTGGDILLIVLVIVFVITAIRKVHAASEAGLETAPNTEQITNKSAATSVSTLQTCVKHIGCNMYK